MSSSMTLANIAGIRNWIVLAANEPATLPLSSGTGGVESKLDGIYLKFDQPSA